MLKKFWYVFLVLLIEVSSLMAAELLGARLLVPFYGSSLYIWTAVLCITMLGLAMGYYSGGRFSAKHAIGKIIKTKGLLFLKINLYLLTRGLKLGSVLYLAGTGTQTRFNPLTPLGAKHEPLRKFLLPVKAIMLVVILLFSVSIVQAATKTWGPTTGGAWTTAGNWSPSGAPATGDDVIINSNQSAAITAVPTISLNSLTINGNCSFNAATAGNTITITGASFIVASGKTFNLGVTNTFNFTISPTGSGTITGAGNKSGTFSGIISGDGSSGTNNTANPNGSVLSLVKIGTDTQTLSGANAYTGATTITLGELRLNPSADITPNTQIVLNRGKLSTTGITALRTITNSSTLQLNANSSIDLGSNVHSLNFANSNAIPWAGTTLTITGWKGTAGSSGTAGKIFFGTGTGILSAAQLAKISFTGYFSPPILLGTGELVPPWVPVLAITGSPTNLGNSCIGIAITPVTYTITNTGTTATGVSVTSNNPQFVVSGAPTTVIGSGGTATYVVTFMPVASLAGDNPVMIGERKNCE